MARGCETANNALEIEERGAELGPGVRDGAMLGRAVGLADNRQRAMQTEEHSPASVEESQAAQREERAAQMEPEEEKEVGAAAPSVAESEAPGEPPTGEETEERLPSLPARSEEVSVERIGACMHAVRSWHRGEPGSGEGLARPESDFVPALMHVYGDASRIRHEYPLFLFPPATTPDERQCLPLSELLRVMVEGFAAGEEEARILKDNLPRLERRVREAMSGIEIPVGAAETLAEAGREVEAELMLGEENADRLHEDLAKLAAGMPKGGTLLGWSEYTSLELFLHAARHRVAARRAALLDEVARLRHKLHDVLLIDIAKEPERRRAEDVEGSVGPAATEHVDTGALARVLGPARGTETMNPARRKRIEKIITLLDRYLDQAKRPVTHVVHSTDASIPATWKAEEAEWHITDDTTVCNAAAALFDEQAAEFAKLFATMRLARLELVDGFDSARHEHLLQGFDWEAFSRDELLALPPVLAVESADQLAGEGMLSISRLQLSGRPVSVLVLVPPGMNPGTSEGDDPLMGYRFELAYRGVSHRESLVHQSSAARPSHLLAGYHRSLQSTRASLHVVASGLTAEGAMPLLGTWLHASAAVESRAHPLLHYDPGVGTTWARRFDFEGNPQPEENWPSYELRYRTAEGETQRLQLAFTFADFALMEPSYREHYRVIPEPCTSEELVTMDEYLEMPAKEFIERIPYTWAVDGEGRLRRLAMSRRLAFVCRDRLGYWRTLQEMAGIRNEHVERAVAAERERLEGAFAEQRQALADEHAAALEEARRTAASEAMQRLAQSLLNTDASSPSVLRPGASAAAAAPPATAQQAAETADELEAEEAAVEEEEDEGSDTPWINSILCTSCNDCINMNPRLFVYNGSKQAMIGDPQAGTYKQLVEAAEKCPSRCIHPGKPLDLDEPGLEELMERAKPFR